MATRASEEPRIQTPDLRILLSHFLRQIEARHVRTKEHPAVPLHYDSKTGNLVEYFWPCEINPDSKKEEDKYRRVRPCDLESYRRTHHFRGPCCLCAFLDDKDYTEAQIAIVEVLTADEGRNHCVLNVCIERFYQLNDIPLRKYPRRVTPLPPVHLIHISDVEKSFRRGEGLFQVMPDVVSRGHHAGFKRVNPRTDESGSGQPLG
ncbi:hypothetical protein NMY22_g20308 [Coprinellus aureogranulatus]|nr:hypothetical protein NMY22_g20308 [Coprinellus aureogranulatus]